jgi:hypothetical protein
MASFDKLLALQSRLWVCQLRQCPGNRQTYYPGRPSFLQGFGASIKRRPGGEYIIYQ